MVVIPVVDCLWSFWVVGLLLVQSVVESLGLTGDQRRGCHWTREPGRFGRRRHVLE